MAGSAAQREEAVKAEVKKRNNGELFKHQITQNHAQKSKYTTKLGSGGLEGRAGANDPLLQQMATGFHEKSIGDIQAKQKRQQETVKEIQSGRPHLQKKAARVELKRTADVALYDRQKMQAFKNKSYQANNAMYHAENLGKRDQKSLATLQEQRNTLVTHLSTMEEGTQEKKAMARETMYVMQQADLMESKVKLEKGLRLGKSYQVELKDKRKRLATVNKELGVLNKQTINSFRPNDPSSFKNRARKFFGMKDGEEVKKQQRSENLAKLQTLRRERAQLQRDLEKLEAKKKFHDMYEEMLSGDKAADSKLLGDPENDKLLEQYIMQLQDQMDQDPDTTALKTQFETFRDAHITELMEMQAKEDGGKDFDTNKAFMERWETDKIAKGENIQKLTIEASERGATLATLKAAIQGLDGLEEEEATKHLTTLLETAGKELDGAEDQIGLKQQLAETTEMLQKEMAELESTQKSVQNMADQGKTDPGKQKQLSLAQKRVSNIKQKQQSLIDKVAEKYKLMNNIQSYMQQMDASKAAQEELNRLQEEYMFNQKRADDVRGQNAELMAGFADEAAYKESLAANREKLVDLKEQIAYKQLALKSANTAKAQRMALLQQRQQEAMKLLAISREVAIYKASGNAEGMSHISETGELMDSKQYNKDQAEIYRSKTDTQEKKLKEQEKAYKLQKNSKDNQDYHKQKEQMRALDALGSADSPEKMAELLKSCPCFKIGDKTVIVFHEMLLSQDGIVDINTLESGDQKVAQKEIEKEKIVRGIESSPAMQFLYAENLEDYATYDDQSGNFQDMYEVKQADVEAASEQVKGKILDRLNNMLEDDSEFSEAKAFVEDIIDGINDFADSEDKKDGFGEFYKTLRGEKTKWDPFSDKGDKALGGVTAAFGFINAIIGAFQSIQMLVDAKGKIGRDKILAALGGIGGMVDSVGSVFEGVAAVSDKVSEFGENVQMPGIFKAVSGSIKMGTDYFAGEEQVEDALYKGNVFDQYAARRAQINNMVGDGADMIAAFDIPMAKFGVNTVANLTNMGISAHESRIAGKRAGDQRDLAKTMQYANQDKDGQVGRTMEAAASQNKQVQAEKGTEAVEAVLKIAADAVEAFVPVIGKYVAIGIRVGVAALGRAVKMLSKCIIDHKEAKSLLSAPHVLGKVKYDKSIVPMEEFNEILRDTVGIRDLGHVFKALKITDAIDLHSGMKLAVAGTKISTIDQVAGALGYRDPSRYANVELSDIMEKMGYKSGVGDWRESLKHCYDGSHEASKGAVRSAWSRAHGWMHRGYATAKVSDAERREIAARNQAMMESSGGAAASQ